MTITESATKLQRALYEREQRRREALIEGWEQAQAGQVKPWAQVKQESFDGD